MDDLHAVHGLLDPVDEVLHPVDGDVFYRRQKFHTVYAEEEVDFVLGYKREDEEQKERPTLELRRKLCGRNLELLRLLGDLVVVLCHWASLRGKSINDKRS